MGLRLRAMRNDRGLTQSELADMIGQTPRVVGSWEREEAALPIDEAARIADIFECSLDELVGREWPRRTVFSDPRQAELNRCWSQLDPERQDRLIGTAHDMEAAKSAGDAAVQSQPDAG